MNIYEAAEILGDNLDFLRMARNPNMDHICQAMGLGIEALQRLQQCRQDNEKLAKEPLPSEVTGDAW